MNRILKLFIIFDEKGLIDLYLLMQKKKQVKLIEMNANLEQANIRLQRFVTRLEQNDCDLVDRFAQDEFGMIGKGEFVLLLSSSMNN